MSEKKQIGHTPSDIIIKIVEHIGFWTTLIILLVVFGAGWLIADLRAEPGERVVIWWLFSYIKKSNEQNINNNVDNSSFSKNHDNHGEGNKNPVKNGEKKPSVIMHWGDNLGILPMDK